MRSCPQCRSIFTGEGEFCSIDGQQLVDDRTDPLIGERIDRYEFVERLGTGAMGVVYRVRHTTLDRYFAIKVLYGEFGADKSLVARFSREARVMSRMSHPNVVSVVDFGTTAHGLNFLVMEHIDGHTLEDLLDAKGKIPPRHAAWIARQVAAGLGEAHRIGFVHRDVKPANVMLSGVPGREHAKVLDFGIVGISDQISSTKLTGTGRIVGTPRYMSPEQARAAAVGPPADLYSLGVMLYEMLSGDVPFPGDILADVLVMHSTVEPAPLAPADGLERVVEQLLVKRFEDRVQSAGEVIAMLDRCFDELAPSFPSVVEDEIPTERPAPVVEELEVPPLAEDDEPPLIPFPRSNSSLEAIIEDLVDAAPPPARSASDSLYDSAPAPFEDSGPRSAVETSGFDRPGSQKLDALVPAPAVQGTFGGVESDELVVKEPTRGRGPLPYFVTFGVVVMLGLGVIVAMPRVVGVDPSTLYRQLVDPTVEASAELANTTHRPTRAAEVAREAPLPTLVPVPMDHRPLVAGADVRAISDRPPAVLAPPPAGAAELAVTLERVLARRGLSSGDLDLLPETRRLVRASRSPKASPPDRAAALRALVAATDRATVTKKMLTQKVRRLRRALVARQRSLPAGAFAELDRRVRKRERQVRRVRPRRFAALATALTALESDLASRATP